MPFKFILKYLYRMKRIYLSTITKAFSSLFILFCSISAMGQTNFSETAKSEKYLLVIYQNATGNGECKAIKITGDTVQIDTAYSLKEKAFTADRKELVQSNHLYTILQNTNGTKWKQIEVAIQKILTCDSTTPFEIELKENNKTERFLLPRIGPCYPEEFDYILEGLEKYFTSK